MKQSSDQRLPPSTRLIYAAFDYVSLHRDGILNLILAAAILTILASGFHVVKKEEAGVVARFGKVIEAHTEPGIHFHIPLIDKVRVQAVKRIATHRIASNSKESVSFTILSGDPTLFEIDLVLQYTISNLRNFLYVSTDPLALTTSLTRGHLVNIVGQNFIDLIFTTNREIIERHLRDQVSTDLEEYDLGMEIVAVSIVDVRPIDETVAAFRDVSDAVAESIQAVSDANRRKESLILRTQGQAEAMVLGATARARERLVQARSSAGAFTDLLAAYRSEPQQVAITRYWNRMRTIFEEAKLAAVSPASSSTIAINMIDGISGRAAEPVASAAMPAAGAEPAKPLVSTGLNETHGLETADKGLFDGQFHRGGKERDHSASANPRSLIFDTLSVFQHEDVAPGSTAAAQQAQEKAIVEQVGAEAPADTVRAVPKESANEVPKE